MSNTTVSSTTTAPAERVINSESKLLHATMSILTDSRLNSQLTVSEATNLIDFLSYFFSDSKNDYDLAYLMGVCYDTNHPDYDRRRFKESIRYLIKNSTVDTNFVLCIDPNFKLRNIVATLSTLLKKSYDKDEKLEIIIKGTSTINWSAIAGMRKAKEIPNIIERAKKAIEYAAPFKHFIMFNYTIKNEAGQSKQFYFMFLNFELPTAGGFPLGHRSQNLLNIQDGTKTLQTYLTDDICKYTNESFYGGLEKIAKMPCVQKVYVASAASSHNKGFLQTEVNGKLKYYRSKYKVQEFGVKGRWYVDPRYLSDFCQLFTLMKNISDADKPVYFITLDTRLPAFKHPSVVLTEQNPASKNAYFSVPPYAVPFNNSTEFFKNDMFQEFILEIPKEGGRQKTRKHKNKRKNRKTRKN